MPHVDGSFTPKRKAVNISQLYMTLLDMREHIQRDEQYEGLYLKILHNLSNTKRIRMSLASNLASGKHKTWLPSFNYATIWQLPPGKRISNIVFYHPQIQITLHGRNVSSVCIKLEKQKQWISMSIIPLKIIYNWENRSSTTTTPLYPWLSLLCTEIIIDNNMTFLMWMRMQMVNHRKEG